VRVRRLCLSLGIMGGIVTIGCSMGTVLRGLSRRGGGRSFRGRMTSEDGDDIATTATSLSSTFTFPFVVFLELSSLASDISDSSALVPCSLLHTTHTYQLQNQDNHYISPLLVLRACILCLKACAYPSNPLIARPCNSVYSLRIVSLSCSGPPRNARPPSGDLCREHLFHRTT